MLGVVGMGLSKMDAPTEHFILAGIMMLIVAVGLYLYKEMRRQQAEMEKELLDVVKAVGITRDKLCDQLIDTREKLLDNMRKTSVLEVQYENLVEKYDKLDKQVNKPEEKPSRVLDLT